MKPFWTSKTFYAAILTGCVAIAKEFFPQYQSQLNLVEQLLAAAGLWFVRAGIGKPVAPMFGK
jgi:uncharacterized membrane protein